MHRRKLFKSFTLTIFRMTNPKKVAIKNLRKLKRDLGEECIKRNLRESGSFTIMFDEEQGRAIRFVRDMPIDATGSMKEFYSRNWPIPNPKYWMIHWPYTGFVQGDMAGWNPISEVRIVEWLNKYHYKVDEFVGVFR